MQCGLAASIRTQVLGFVQIALACRFDGKTILQGLDCNIVGIGAILCSSFFGCGFCCDSNGIDFGIARRFDQLDGLFAIGYFGITNGM